MLKQFLTGCIALMITYQTAAQEIEVRVDGNLHVRRPFLSGVHVEFRNSPTLTAVFTTELRQAGAQIRETASSETYRLLLYGYYSSRDSLGRVRAADIGRIKEGVDAKGDPSHSATVSDGVAWEAGKLFGSAGAGYAAATVVATIQNLLNSPEDGQEDQLLRNRFVGKEGANAAQVVVVLAPPGVEPRPSAIARPGKVMIIVAKPKAGEGAAHETIQAAVKAAVEAIKRAIKEGA